MVEPVAMERALRRVLWELRDYLPDLVLIGGWVPYLYRRYGGLGAWSSGESLTFEVDLLADIELPAKGRATIAESLRAAGFRPVNESESPAVWVLDPEKGERVEFFVPHRGPARRRGHTLAVVDQPGLGGISLDGLSFLRAHSRQINVAAEDAAGNRAIVDVRVPRLGAFVVNKAMTFPQRPAGVGDSGELKRAKDILYLRDLMAAGSAVTEHIAAEVAELSRGPAESRRHVEKTLQNVRLLRDGQWAAALEETAAMLVERGDHDSREGALSDIRGHLDDLHELLASSA